MIKKLITTVFAILFTLVAFSQTIPFGQGYVINGELKRDTVGFVTLRSYFRDGNERVDTAYINNGKFTLRSPLAEVIPAQLTINGMRGFRIYLEPTTYTITIDAEQASKTTIKGSTWTDKWIEVTTPLKDEDYDVHMRRLENWVLNNPDNIFCSDIISSFLSYTWGYEDLFRTLNTLKKPATQTYHYLKLREREKNLQTVAIGQKAPDFTMTNINGKRTNLYNYLRGKKFLLIDFWASWCRPCREENPNVVIAKEKFNSKGFDVLGVSLDKNGKDWKEAVKNDYLNWEQVSDLKMWDNEAAKLYMINAIPSNILIDDNGIIIAKNLKGTELISKLDELTNSYGYSINGNISGVSDGKVNLNLLLEGGEKKNYTTQMIDGVFEFKGVVNFVCVAQIILPTRNGDFTFFMENDKITINGSKENLDNISIKGSPKNDIYANFVNGCNKSRNPIQSLMDNVVKNPTTFYAPLVISNYLAPYLSNIELKELVSSLNNDAKRMYQYKLLQDYILELQGKEKIGEQAIDFTLANTNGIDVKLSDFIKGKEYILIDFWASWCTPCRGESKFLVQAYNKFKPKGFDILSVSLDKDKTKWLKGIDEDGLVWENVSDLLQWNSIVVKLYKLESIPQNILVDSEGNIVGRNLRGDNLMQTLNELFVK
ncbi:MAG: redoxin domain-containing protein [Bacteroidales bacterium]|jgi:peroxiredoxin